MGFLMVIDYSIHISTLQTGDAQNLYFRVSFALLLSGFRHNSSTEHLAEQ